MTTAILLASVAVLTVLAVAGWAVAWWQSGVIGRLTETRHACSRPRGDASPARPGTSLVSDREAAEHADAMHAVSEPFLPSGSHAQTWPRLTERTVPVKPTADRAPWETRTAAQPVLSQEEQAERAAFVRSQLPLHEEDATREDMELALALLRERTAVNLPPEPVYEPTDEQTRELYFGGAPVADVLAAGQEGRLAS